MGSQKVGHNWVTYTFHFQSMLQIWIHSLIFIEGPQWVRLRWGSMDIMLKRNLQGRRDRTSFNSLTHMCKISVTESFTEERVLWEGIIKRSDLIWAEVGFWKRVSEHWRMRSGERVLDERSCDRRAEIWVFKCQIHCDSSLGVQEYIPGTCISTSTSGNPFPP